MNKLIFKVVGAAAVSALFCVGCSEEPGGGDPNDPNNPNNNGGGGLTGDWSVKERVDDEGSQTLPEDYIKIFFSLNSSGGDLVMTQFFKVSDFWIESAFKIGKYSIKGDSICVEDEDCKEYSISGDNLTFSVPTGSSCDMDGCNTIFSTVKAVRGNIANTRTSFGNNLKTQAAELSGTNWTKPSSDPDCEWCGSSIVLGSGYYAEYAQEYGQGVYLPEESDDAVWYTEGGNLILVSESANATVTLEYQLSGETLRLKAPGGDWDEWTLLSGYGDGSYKRRASAKSKRDSRAVGLFQAFRR